MKNFTGFLLLLIGLATIHLNGFAQQIQDTPPRDGVYDKINTIEKKPVSYAYVREADIFWQKRLWQVIDFREKMNQPLYYPESQHSGWRSFMTVIMDALKEGTLTAYDATSSTDEMIVPLTYQEIIGRLERADTQQMQRPYPPYDFYDTIITNTFNASDVKKIRIKEDWFFDKQRSMMDVRIIGICPVKASFDEKGNYRGDEPLFWIYFPEARNILAKAEVFNRNNGSNRLTFDDLFWKRMFSSYVYKEDNVYDRKITQYAQGLDALLEAQRIKDDMFNYEHDLWEY
jgi:gliding motility associated protien GldN